MVQKNNVIRKRDFEKYNLLIPFIYAAGKRRKKYLYSELEKMHPCFSDEFCFDSAIRKIGRKGINADVLVMNKITLAEYEGRRHFCGSGFFAEESGSRHRFFISSKIKSFFTAGIACLIISCSGIILGAFCGRANQKLKNPAPELSEPIVSHTQEEEDKENWNLEKAFFQTVLECKGKIDSFEWRLDGGYETFSASLKGIFPENLSAFENWKKNTGALQVIYENNEPEMKVSYAKKINMGEASDDNSGAELNASDFNKLIRSCLKDFNASIKEEKLFPYQIEFMVSAGESAEKLFEKLSEIIFQNGRAVTYINFCRNGKNDDSAFIVRLSCEPLSSLQAIHLSLSGFDLRIFSAFFECFSFEIKAAKASNQNVLVGTQNLKPEKSSENPPEKIIEKNFEEKQEKLFKIGEIQNGSQTVVFYKNAEGKMEKRILHRGNEL